MKKRKVIKQIICKNGTPNEILICDYARRVKYNCLYANHDREKVNKLCGDNYICEIKC